MESLEQRVLKGLDEIRPYLQSDGGDINLVDISDGVVKVQFTGSCVSCSVNQMTLRSGVEMTIKKHAPEIREVINLGLEEVKQLVKDSIDVEGNKLGRFND